MMQDLVVSEIQRVASRRLTRVLAVLGVLAALTIGAVLFVQTSSADADVALRSQRASVRSRDFCPDANDALVTRRLT